MTSDSLPGEFQTGDVVGNTYKVLGYIGRGAMGHVYRVRHTGLNSEYALKTLSSEYVNELAWLRFQNEAQAISILQHPNVVSVFNLGLHNSHLPFYVMELLVGKDLGEKIRKEGPLDLKTAIAIFTEVCAGISYAHKKGIVHRDIKPSNVFLLAVPGPTGETVKVVDFGIAKLTQPKSQTIQALTGVGDVLGTPYYMSPEQSAGQSIDTRSDIYSLGCTLFEALTGSVPFRGRNATETMMLHNSAAPPTLQKASGGRVFPQALEAVIAKTLEKTPAKRYQTMEQLIEDLTSVMQAGGEANAGREHAITAGRTNPVREQAGLSGKANVSREHALASRERAIASREHAIVGGGNDGDAVSTGEADAKSEWQGKILILSVVALIVVAAVVTILFGRPGLNTKPKAIANAQPQLQLPDPAEIAPAVTKTVATVKSIDSTDQLLEEVNRAEIYGGDATGLLGARQKVTPSLRTGKPFSTIEGVGADASRVFRFPPDVVIGAIKTGVMAKPFCAIAELKYPKSAQVWFSPGKIVGEYPQCMQRFKPDDISILRIDPQACSDQILIACQHLSGIRKLDLSKCFGLTRDSISALSHFKEISAFNASDSQVTGPLLSKANCWDKVKVVDYSGAKDPLPFLVRLKQAKLLTRLSLTRSKLSGADFRAVSELHRLTELDLFQVPMTKQDLSSLSALDDLRSLRIGETGLRASDLDVLKNFKSLTWLDFCGNPLTKADLASLIRLRDFERLDLQRTGIDLQSISVLKDYKSLRALRIGSKGWLKKGELEQIQTALPGVKVW